MRFVNRDEDRIESLPDWEALGKPASASHWRPNRSAYELASAWIDGEAVDRVTELLGMRPEFAGVRLREGVAEKPTQFDQNPRGPRNHDLLVRATTNSGELMVGVEGKADEPFDLPLWRWRERALAASPGSDAPRRLDDLTTLFFETTIDHDRGHPPLACIGYQLLSALAGTLADAKRDGARQSVLLIHEFVTSETEDANHVANGRVLEDFLTRLAGDVERDGSADAWITAPFPVRGDGMWLPESCQVAVAKLVTNRRRVTPATSPGFP
jgi:hypothetical protein